MTEFKPLLKKTNLSYNNIPSAEESESSKPLLRKTVETRYRPKSMSMIARSEYASSEVLRSSTNSITSESWVKANRGLNVRPTSYHEERIQRVKIIETNAEKLFIKAVNFHSTQTQEQVKVTSVDSVKLMLPSSTSEPLKIENLESPPESSNEIEEDLFAEEEITTHDANKVVDDNEEQEKEDILSYESVDAKKSMDSPVNEIPIAKFKLVGEADGDVIFLETGEVDEDVKSVSSDTSSASYGHNRVTSPTSVEDQENLNPQTCPIIPGKETMIEIVKGRIGLGVSVVGGSDSLLKSILVHTIYEDGAAAKDGRLWPGDRILSVNHHDLRKATHDEAIDKLRNSPMKVHLAVLRDENRAKMFLRYQRKIKIPVLSYWERINNESDGDVYDMYDVQLTKRSGRGLGLSIVGRRNDPGVFVSDVTSGSVAHKEGTLRKGDQILAVNGVDLKMSGQEVAAQLLKNTYGKIDLKIGRLKAGIPDDLMFPPKLSLTATSDEGRSITTVEREERKSRFVEIEKPPNTLLGISISGGIGSPFGDVPIFVALVRDDGPAARKLKPGDKILSVNGQSTERKTHDEVVEMMKNTEDLIVLMQVKDGGEEIQKLTDYLRLAASSVAGKFHKSDVLSTENLDGSNVKQNKEEAVIELQRGPEGLGFTIIGGHGCPHGDLPIYVKGVSPVGAAATDGRLKKGDKIVEVNGERLDGYTHEQAAEVMKNHSSIVLKVVPA